MLEASDSESELHARVQFEGLMQKALEAEIITDAVIAESLAQAKTLWLIRENITMAQAAQGLNIKHDISLPVSQIASFVLHTDALIAKKIDGVRIVNFGRIDPKNREEIGWRGLMRSTGQF